MYKEVLVRKIAFIDSVVRAKKDDEITRSPDKERGERNPEPPDRHPMVDDDAVVWRRTPVDGVLPSQNQGYRFFAQ